jgi:hypothetical protein
VRPGDRVRLTATAETFGGDVPAGAVGTLVAAWEEDGERFVSVRFSAGDPPVWLGHRGVCRIRAERVSLVEPKPEEKSRDDGSGGKRRH